MTVAVLTLHSSGRQACIIHNHLPGLQIRNMPLADFERQYPDDLKSGALEEIRARYVALAAEAATSLPATTATKRGRSEVPTALRTVRPRRGAAAAGPVIPPPKFADNGVPAAAAGKRHGAGPVADDLCTYQQQHKQFAGRPAPSTLFHGLPLQTPMPFAGEAVPVPVTLLTQKRGGRMRSAAAPDAAIITTADGKQWAVSAAGTEAIPDSHRNEVESLLNAQFEFIAAALGKTVFSRGRR